MSPQPNPAAPTSVSIPRDFVVARDVVSYTPKPLEVFVNSGPKWRRRLAERFLRWAIRVLKAESRAESTVRTFTAARGDSLLARLNMQQRDMQLIYDRRAEWLLCGPQALYELETDARKCAPYSLGHQTFEFGGHRGRQIVGLNVVMIPWMDGYLLVPKLEVGNR